MHETPKPEKDVSRDDAALLQPGEFGYRRVVAAKPNEEQREYDVFGRTESGTYLALNAGEVAVAHELSEQEDGGAPAFLQPHRIPATGVHSSQVLNERGELDKK